MKEEREEETGRKKERVSERETRRERERERERDRERERGREREGGSRPTESSHLLQNISQLNDRLLWKVLEARHTETHTDK